jgi:hypothetical protein
MSDLTSHELEAITEYNEAIAGIPESFDGLDIADYTVAELAERAPMLSRWWGAIDTLDSQLGGWPNPPSVAAQLRLSGVIGEFLQVRQKFLFALARANGVKLPQPDHDGAIVTSNHTRGYFSHHDPALGDRLRKHREGAEGPFFEDLWGQLGGAKCNG